MNGKHALVISGGGSRGAWGVGIAKALVEQKGISYSTVVGTSTGSLMGPLVLDDDFDTLVSAYTSVTQSSIFDVNPFKPDGSLRALPSLWRLITGKQSIGETNNLKKLIYQFVTKDLYNKLKATDKVFGATVTSMVKGKPEVKTLHDHSYEHIIDWIWASANQPILMTMVKKDGDAWGDGGMTDYASVEYVVKNNLADHIDVIIHSAPGIIDQKFDVNSKMFGILLRIIDIFTADVIKGDLEKARLDVKIEKELTIDFYFMPDELVNKMKNPLVFSKEIMAPALMEGYESVINNTCIVEHCKVGRDGQIRLL